MTEPSASEKRERKSIGGDLVIPVMALALAVYYIYSILDAPWTAKVGTYFVAAILIVLVVIFLVKTFVTARKGHTDWSMGQIVSPASFVPRRLALLALTMAYIFLVQWGGFTITTFVFLYAAMLLLGGRSVQRRALILSATFALGGYLLFIAAFQTRFPAGPFEQLMKGLF